MQGTSTIWKCARRVDAPGPLVAGQFCEVLMRRSRFEPARDAWGTAVSKSYAGRINFDMPIKPDR